MSELPKGWALAPFGDVVNNHDGTRVPVTLSDRRPGPFPYYGASGVVDHVDRYLFDGEYLLISEDGANLLARSTPIAFRAAGQFWVNNHAHIVSPRPGIEIRFLENYVEAQDLRFMITGTAQPKLTQAALNRLPVAIPPSNEQHRIVAKLDAVFDKSRAAKARLERLPALLEKLKRSILAAAFRGDLTKDWRAAHPDVEPASVLLERIRAERRRRWEEGLRAKGKDPKKATYEEPAAVDVAGLPELPEGWAWAPAELVVEAGTIITYGIVLPGKHIVDGVPYVRQQDVQDGGINVADLLRTAPEIAAKFERSSLQEGDVLLCIIRHRRVAIVPAGLDGANITQGTVRLRPSLAARGPYLAAWLESPVAQRWMEGRVFGLDMPRINVGDTREIPVPVAPPAEQAQIVDVLARALAGVAGLSTASDSTARKSLRLEQAALAKAFRGELVAQDPTDEPASVLLDRIRAARADEPQRARRGRPARPADPELFAGKPAAPRASNGHRAEADEGEPVELVVAAFQLAPRLTATSICTTTGLDAASVKKALKALVDGGQVRVEGKARGTAYVWGG